MSWIILESLFLIAVAGILYTFAGYHLLMALAAKRKKRSACAEPTGTESPHVTVLLAMGNEESHAVSRLENLLKSDYAPMDIIVVLDKPTDKTAEVLEAYSQNKGVDYPAPVHILPMESKSGKAACINHGLGQAQGEIILFCDARQTFESKAIRKLADHFADPRVGAVSGELMISDASAGDMGAYWRMEKALRRNESTVTSVIGCTGAVYACRKSLIKPIPEDTILDDVVIPMRCLEQGYSVKFESEAIAYDPKPSTHDNEATRKIRTLAGNWQLVFRYPQWLLPGKGTHPFQLLSHKYLRLLGPYMLATAFVSNLFLASYCPVFQATLLIQGAFYLLATLGLLFPSVKTRVVALPATFTYLNWLNAAALLYYLKGDYKTGWKL